MKRLVAILLFAGISGCGVKGDPVAPATPTELGRGQPTYKKATEDFAFPDVPTVYEDQEKKDESGR